MFLCPLCCGVGIADGPIRENLIGCDGLRLSVRELFSPLKREVDVVRSEVGGDRFQRRFFGGNVSLRGRPQATCPDVIAADSRILLS